MTTARLALLAVIWGSSFLWIKLSLRGLSPLEVTFGRLVLGSMVEKAVTRSVDALRARDIGTARAISRKLCEFLNVRTPENEINKPSDSAVSASVDEAVKQ